MIPNTVAGGGGIVLPDTAIGRYPWFFAKAKPLL